MTKQGKILIVYLIVLEIMYISTFYIVRYVGVSLDNGIGIEEANKIMGPIGFLFSLVFPLILATKFKERVFTKYFGILLIVNSTRHFLVSFLSNSYREFEIALSIILVILLLILLFYSTKNNGFGSLQWLMIAVLVSWIPYIQFGFSALYLKLYALGLVENSYMDIVISISLIVRYIYFVLSLIVIESECKIFKKRKEELV